MRIHYVFGLAAAALLTTGTARADDFSCHEQARKLCGDLEPGDGRMHECVKEHKAEFTPDCQARFDKMREKLKELFAVCADDLKQKCSDVVPGGARKLMCLASHEPTLTPACAAAIKRGREKLHAMHACHEDAARLCPEVPRGDGRVKDCLEQHRAQLSPACGSALGE